MNKKLILLSPLILLVFLLFIALGGEIVKLLWNALLPPLFDWPQLSFWQALGMLALCRILFGGFRLGGGGSNRSGYRSRKAFRRRMAERWESMTPEQRERFRKGTSGWCGPGPSTEEST